ncbi:MAG: asparagine synthase (glutamine-hydrolyzing) [Patescibacteria group bacterium]
MCGIVGFIDKQDRLTPADKRWVISSMFKRVEHRGRDGEGIIVKGRVAMGHTRLSIIDVNAAADQPFISDDGNLSLVYNGEIYNYSELDRQLRMKYRYQTNCDTETLLYAYNEWGIKLVEKIHGMFAFSLHDAVKDLVFFAVDRFSIKPLYYIDTDNFFAWASEAKALLELPDFRPTLNIGSLSEFLSFRQFGGQETPWEEIKRMLPAQVLVYDLKRNSFEEFEYWNERQEIGGMPTSDEEIFDVLTRAVERHLIADVPIGLQLSGGVDSSLVAAIASRIKPVQFHTFSIGLSDEAWNEFKYSRQVAVQIGSEHHEIIFDEEDFCRILPLAIYQHDEPLSHPHSVPMLILSLEARRYVKVLLSGEGADELFGGYTRYTKLFTEELDEEAWIFLNAFNQIDDLVRLFPDLNRPDLDYRRSILDKIPVQDDVERVLALDRRTYLQSLLIRQDKMGMAANLENRVPFLDQEVVKVALNLPSIRKVTATETKICLKKAARRVLPTEIVDRKKCGFGLPVGEWFRHPEGLGRYLKILQSKDSLVRSLAREQVLDEMMSSHLSGTANNTEILWVVLNLELWYRIFVLGQVPDIVWESL